MMNENATTTETTEIKTNRYVILGTELKRLSAELKAKKKEMVEGIRKLEAEYRAYRKDIYTPARKAAWQTFNETKVRVAKPKTEIETAANKKAKEKKVKTVVKVSSTNKKAKGKKVKAAVEAVATDKIA